MHFVDILAVGINLEDQIVLGIGQVVGRKLKYEILIFLVSFLDGALREDGIGIRYILFRLGFGNIFIRKILFKI